jgi:GAF domain-containing protein
MELPLSYGNVGLGRLVIGRADGSLSRWERRLLADLSRQAAVALHGLLLSEDV